YLSAIKTLEPFGIPLHAAMQEYAALKTKNDVAPRRVREVVDEALTRKKVDGKSKRYIDTLKSYVNRFADRFQTNISSVTTVMIVHWLDSLNLSPRSRNNAREAIVSLFHFAQRHGYLPKGQATEADDVERVRAHDGEIAVLKPAQLALLLRKAPPTYQLFF